MPKLPPPNTTPLTKLPKGIKQADLKINYKRWRANSLTKAQEAKLTALGYSAYGRTTFQLWLASGEWMIPTLSISGRVRAGSTRTYAVGVADKKTYRIGNGPHVTAQHTVYVTRSNFDRLLPFLEMQLEGAKSANEIRDRISSRRAQGQVYRAQGRRSWYW